MRPDPVSEKTRAAFRAENVARDPLLDRVRGLAVLLMVADHSVAVFAPYAGHWYRLTVARAAVPIFFTLAGHLYRHVGGRTLLVGLVGLVLPVVVPWANRPDVLVWWSTGCLLLWLCDRVPGTWARPVLVAVGLTLGANGIGLHHHTFEPCALYGLMAFGGLLPRSVWSWSRRLPSVLAVVGRRPIVVYVGHYLVLETVALCLYR